ncbi:Tenascin [Liparis tanakae]|uniref:Tenascin n=1 Tax=Liparis tanakae TaxID=230148 RepID=A0A4Z2EYM1_9TELE|nr:Tenascin [Liparis tanakae]
MTSFTQTGLAAGQDYTVSVTGETGGRKGAESAAQFTTLTSGPANLRVVKTTSTSAVVQWEQSQGEIDRYRLTATPTDGRGRSQEMTVPAGRDSAHIGQLEAGRSYDVVLVAEKGTSRSKPATNQVTPGKTLPKVTAIPLAPAPGRDAGDGHREVIPSAQGHHLQGRREDGGEEVKVGGPDDPHKDAPTSGAARAEPLLGKKMGINGTAPKVTLYRKPRVRFNTTRVVTGWRPFSPLKRRPVGPKKTAPVGLKKLKPGVPAIREGTIALARTGPGVEALRVDKNPAPTSGTDSDSDSQSISEGPTAAAGSKEQPDVGEAGRGGDAAAESPELTGTAGRQEKKCLNKVQVTHIRLPHRGEGYRGEGTVPGSGLASSDTDDLERSSAETDLDRSPDPLRKLLTDTFDSLNITTFSVHMSKPSDIPADAEPERKQILKGLRPFITFTRFLFITTTFLILFSIGSLFITTTFLILFSIGSLFITTTFLILFSIGSLFITTTFLILFSIGSLFITTTFLILFSIGSLFITTTFLILFSIGSLFITTTFLVLFSIGSLFITTTFLIPFFRDSPEDKSKHFVVTSGDAGNEEEGEDSEEEGGSEEEEEIESENGRSADGNRVPEGSDEPLTKALAGSARPFPLEDRPPRPEFTVTLLGGGPGRLPRLVISTGPEPPTGLVFGRLTDSSVTVSWTKPTTSVSGFKVTYTHTEEDEPVSVSVASGDSSLGLAALAPGSSYEVSVVSVLGLDESDPITEHVATLPDPPTDLQAVKVTDTEALLLWRPALAAVDKYAIVYGAGTGSAQQQLHGLQGGATYTVTVSSQQGAAESSGASTRFTTTGGSRDLRDLQADDVTPRSALLSWKPPSSPAGGLRLTYGSEGHPEKEVVLDASLTEYHLTRLHPGSTYAVQLRAEGGASVTTDFTTGTLRFPFPTDCSQELLNGIRTSGAVEVFPRGKLGTPVTVSCDMETDGGGWTVFQRRKDGSVDFFRGWKDYIKGFGSPSGEFWLGLESLYSLTSMTPMSLRVDLRDKDEAAFAKYSKFELVKRNYKLIVGGYSGTAGDSLSYHSERIFSTRDRDLSPFITRCAMSYRGGWWYKNCHEANLNGAYGTDSNHQVAELTQGHLLLNLTQGHLLLNLTQAALNQASGEGEESVSSPEPLLDDRAAGVRTRRRTKRIRTCFRSEQLRALESYFAQKHNPDGKDWNCLAHKTGLPKRVLQVDSPSAYPGGGVALAPAPPPDRPLAPPPPSSSSSTIDQLQLSLLTAPLGEPPGSPASFYPDYDSQSAPGCLSSLEVFEDFEEAGAAEGGGRPHASFAPHYC